MDYINVGGQLLDLRFPIPMGILNVTPDSFYDGGSFSKVDDAMGRVAQMIEEGAQIIDIGGFSSRPTAKMISEEEELNRIIPVIAEIKKQFPKAILSVDTYRSKVVQSVLKYTDFIVNDITAGSKDETLFEVVSANNLPYILMHMQGSPENMQLNPSYEKSVTAELLDFFAKGIFELKQKDIHQLIIDPGFGFGKQIEHNYELLKKLNVFNIYELPIMVGLSRKSMIHKALEIDAKDALNGTTALHMAALLNGAKILRVHDVKEAVQTIKLYRNYVGCDDL